MFGVSPLMMGRAPALSAGVSQTSWSQSGTNGTQTTPEILCTPSGGVPPYSYSWQRVSGTSEISITSQNSASTTFSSYLLDGETDTATFVCVVTDAIGQNATSPSVLITLTREYNVRASLSHASISATGSGSGFVGTGPVTCSATGGVGPYTFQWLKFDGDNIGIGAAGSATTAFSSPVMDPGETRTARFWCRATDSLGNNDISNWVTVTLTRTS